MPAGAATENLPGDTIVKVAVVNTGWVQVGVAERRPSRNAQQAPNASSERQNPGCTGRAGYSGHEAYCGFGLNRL
jgi:hypothetical protein